MFQPSAPGATNAYPVRPCWGLSLRRFLRAVTDRTIGGVIRICCHRRLQQISQALPIEKGHRQSRCQTTHRKLRRIHQTKMRIG
jgi:hypothetical protein